MAPNSHILLMTVCREGKFFTVEDLYGAFCSISVDSESQFLFAFMWEEQQYT